LYLAGLLTYSLSGHLPIPFEPEQWLDFQERITSLQQRELFPIFTGFPFNPFRFQAEQNQLRREGK
jgi:hypothetical protein